MHTEKADTILFSIKYANVSVHFGSTVSIFHNVGYIIPCKVRAFYLNINVPVTFGCSSFPIYKFALYQFTRASTHLVLFPGVSLLLSGDMYFI